MTHQAMDNAQPRHELADITAADEANPSIARQIFNGLSGTLILLLAGVIVLVVVLWKAP
ncbi:hypothetical protein [Devosia limi]|uniref:Uncharacterized protein n=1 Tax=Devosia limi DSM 17137 TaxID=1121477 RepID=A0A1M5B6U4_9HYPH|nr:hypothetical protein [Devosia limi]SHF37912.1 hypothetical protein SAMN02745223_02440 [Devosia limi DSM 17137]